MKLIELLRFFQDLQTIDVEPYQFSGVNFTGVRLIDPENPVVNSTMIRHQHEWGLEDPRKLRVEHALMYDAVQLFARAFKRLKDTIKGDVKKLPCNGSVSWEHGFSLNNFIRVVSWSTRCLITVLDHLVRKLSRINFRAKWKV